uniref:Uncharacterized protein n=1 Tax=Panagrolaimus davidi TaxID=227884 RepID=A0A914QL54_9BILA
MLILVGGADTTTAAQVRGGADTISSAFVHIDTLETGSGNASTSIDPSNEYPYMAFTQSSNLDRSTSTTQYDEESFLQMSEESPPEPLTPARRLPAHAHRDGGKKFRHASIPASALHSAIQQTVSHQSSSATPTSTQDRDPSPSIFD